MKKITVLNSTPMVKDYLKSLRIKTYGGNMPGSNALKLCSGEKGQYKYTINAGIPFFERKKEEQRDILMGMLIVWGNFLEIRGYGSNNMNKLTKLAKKLSNKFNTKVTLNLENKNEEIITFTTDAFRNMGI